jgi:hypothetical protein
VDPTLLFAAVEPRTTDPRRTDSVSESVIAQIRQQRLARTLRPRRRPWLAAAAAVLVTVGGVTAWRVTQEGNGPAPDPAIEARDTSPQAAPPPQVQVDMPGEGVRVYQFAGDGNRDTAVYYIVNPALES